jgi:type I restriction enzyme, S subunit
MNMLPTGWAEATIDELRAPEPNAITDGPYGSSLKTSHYRPVGARVIRLGNIASRNFVNDDVAYISQEHFNNLSKHQVIGDDILVAALGDPVGRACLAPCDLGPALVKADCFRVRLSPELSPHLLMLWLNSNQAHAAFSKSAHGLGRVRINLSNLRATVVPVPPHAEQRRIVSKINSLSAKSKRARDQLNHIPRLVEKYKQAILTAAFDEARRAANAETALSNIALEVRNGLSEKPNDNPPGTPILRISAVRPLAVNTEDRRYYPLAEAIPSKFFLRNGDLLFTRYNGNPDFTAVCGVVRDLSDQLVYPDKLICVRLHESALPDFIELIFASRQARTWLWPRIKTAAGQHGISGKDLKQFPVPLPSIAQQADIVRRARATLTWLDRLASEATSAWKLIDHLHQAILAKAFRGELVPQDPNDEPASVLLERIRAERAAATAKVKSRAKQVRPSTTHRVKKSRNSSKRKHK